jgi:2-polyprenyl-3-methyl-5-hydroxy-6-metoxy-1,4-benzoquinol methylase
MFCRACNQSFTPHNYAIQDSISTIYSCPACGLWQSFPCDREYHALMSRYENTNIVGYYDKVLVKEWYSSKYISLFRHLEKLSILPPISKRFIFLDYGCGMGWSMEIAKEHYFQNAIGIEMNKSLLNYNKEAGRSCLSVPELDWHSLRSPNSKISLCLVDNVLEHLLQPAELLKDLQSSMPVNSVLVVAVPGVDISRKVLARSTFFRSLVPNPTLNILNDRIEHVSFFNRSSMIKLLRDYGFKLIDNTFHHSKLFRRLRLHRFLQTGYYIAEKF